MKSINKGKKFERETATLLTEATGRAWHRVPSSGSLSEDNTQWTGDVYSLAPEYKDITIECKHYRNITINSLFLTKSTFHKAVQQTRREAKGQPWLLFIKANNQGILLVHEALSSAQLHLILDKIPKYTPQMALGLLNIDKIMKK